MFRVFEPPFNFQQLIINRSALGKTLPQNINRSSEKRSHTTQVSKVAQPDMCGTQKLPNFLQLWT